MIHEAIRTILTGSTTITNLVGDKVRPGEFECDDKLPGIIYMIPSDEPVQDISGSSTSRQANLVILATSYVLGTSKTIIEAVQTAMKNAEGTYSLIQITAIWDEGVDEETVPLDDGSDRTEFGFIQKFLVHYERLSA